VVFEPDGSTQAVEFPKLRQCSRRGGVGGL
jgi:hypothetical protein